MEGSGRSPSWLHLPGLITLSSCMPVVGLVGYCFRTTVVRIDSHDGRIVTMRRDGCTHYWAPGKQRDVERREKKILMA